MRRLLSIFSVLIIVTAVLKGQETEYGPSFQTILMNNPSFSGASDEGILRISYMNFYPGNNYDLHSFFASYDSYFDELHGGAGIWIADDYLGGIVNDVRGGLSYAYSLRAGREVYINAGLTAALFHRGFNFGGAVLPDMIGTLGEIAGPSAESLAEEGRTVFDISTGFLLSYRNFFWGLSVNHLSQPDLSNGNIPDRLSRKILLTASLITGAENKISLRPFAYSEFRAGYFLAAAGVSAETKHISVSVILSDGNARNVNLQSGFAINTGRIGIFYNYRFSVAASSGMMPFSLLHQTGLSIGLNPVDKREVAGTIRMPRM